MTSNVRFWTGAAAGMAVVLLVVAWGLAQWNLGHFSQRVSDRLLLLAELRRGAVQEYFSTAEAELSFWSTDPEIIETQKSLEALWQQHSAAVRAAYVENNPNPEGSRLNLDKAEDGSPYSEFHGQMHPVLRQFVTHRGYYDFFLLSPEGDVMYTVEKEADFATNLNSGPWQDSGLARVFREVSRNPEPGRLVLTDMEAYEPSGGEPAMFLATALYSDAGEYIGVIALQLPVDQLLDIMKYTSGMGETGETYLVGPDKLMRSDSRFVQEHTALKQLVDTPTVRRALAGEQGIDIIEDYRGVEVISVFVPIQVGDLTWAVMAEIDHDEVVAGAASYRPALAAPLLLMYGLSLWSVWYWRVRELPEAGEHFAGMDFADSSDVGGLDG